MGCIKMNEIINMFVNNGVAVAVVAYYLYRDYKYNERIILLLNDIKTIVQRLNDELE